MWSPTRRILEPDASRYYGEIHAFRQYFTNVTGVARDQLWVSFEKDLLPGYVWSFPIGNGQANVGFGIERKSGKTVQWMAKKWPEILARPHVREALGPDAVAESAAPVLANPGQVASRSPDGQVGSRASSSVTALVPSTR